MLEQIILGFLHVWGVQSGYDIKQSMVKSTDYFHNASYGSIYPTLKKLEQNGLAVSKESVENGKFKKIYAITETGSEAFLEWMRNPGEADLDEILTRLFFCKALQKDQIIKVFNHYIEKRKRTQSELRGLDDEWNTTNILEKAALRFGLDNSSAQIKWLEDFVDQVRKL